MVRIVVSEGSKIAVNGEITSWDLHDETCTVLLGGEEYEALMTHDGDGYIVLFDEDSLRFLTSDFYRSLVK